MTSGQRHALLVVVAAAILAFANNQSIGVTVPVFLARDLGRTAADVGLVGALATLGAVTGRLVASHLIGRFGRRAVLVTGAALMALLSVSYLTAGSLAAVAAIRSVHLLAFAAVTTTAVIAAVETAPPRRRGAALAAIGMAMPISAMVFPVVAAEGLQAQLGMVSLLATALAVMAAGLFVWAGNGQRAIAVSPTAPIIHHSPLAPASALAILSATALGATDAVAIDLLPVLAIQRGIDGYGWFYTAFALAMLVTLVLLWYIRWQDHAHRVTQVGLIGSGIAFCLLATATRLETLILSAAIFGLGFATAQTGLTVWTVSQSDHHQRGQRIGRLYLVFDVGRSVGVYAGGWGATVIGFAPVLFLVAAYCGLFGLGLWHVGTVAVQRDQSVR